jgi:membrane protein YqaA with SNARE-associated domain
MFKAILLILLFFVFIGGLFGFSMGRFLFGSSTRNRQFQQKNRQTQQKKKQNQTKPIKKIIQKDEGEYIDFEEVKD